MKLLILIVICCPIALIYLVPRYVKLRERYIELEKNSVSVKKYNELLTEFKQLKELIAKKNKATGSNDAKAQSNT